MSMHYHYLAEESKHVFSVTDNGIAYYYNSELVHTTTPDNLYQAMLEALKIQHVTEKEMSELIFRGEDTTGTYLAEVGNDTYALVRWGVNIGSVTLEEDGQEDVAALAAAHQNVIICNHDIWDENGNALDRHSHEPQDAFDDVRDDIQKVIAAADAAHAAMSEDGEGAAAATLASAVDMLRAARASLAEEH